MLTLTRISLVKLDWTRLRHDSYSVDVFWGQGPEPPIRPGREWLKIVLYVYGKQYEALGSAVQIHSIYESVIPLKVSPYRLYRLQIISYNSGVP